MGFLSRFRRRTPDLSPYFEALQAPDPDARLQALRALRSLRPELSAHWEAIRRLLGDPAPSVALGAADFLLSFGRDVEAAQALALRLRTHAEEGVRAEACRLLGRFPAQEEALQGLLESLGDPDPAVRAAAAQALAAFEEKALEPLLERLRTGADPVREAAAEALNALAPRTIPALLALTDAEEATARAAAALALGPLLPADEHVDLLLEALGHPDWVLRRWAARTLATLGPEVRDRAVKPLEARLEDPHAQVRAAAAEALRRLAGPRR